VSAGADGILEALERLQKGSFFHQGQICLTGGRDSIAKLPKQLGLLL
jgi:acyl-CoA reductase-like NAD-dependent aldehyde dehydrogenase